MAFVRIIWEILETIAYLFIAFFIWVWEAGRYHIVPGSIRKRRMQELWEDSGEKTGPTEEPRVISKPASVAGQPVGLKSLMEERAKWPDVYVNIINDSVRRMTKTRGINNREYMQRLWQKIEDREPHRIFIRARPILPQGFTTVEFIHPAELFDSDWSPALLSGGIFQPLLELSRILPEARKKILDDILDFGTMGCAEDALAGIADELEILHDLALSLDIPSGSGDFLRLSQGLRRLKVNDMPVYDAHVRLKFNEKDLSLLLDPSGERNYFYNNGPGVV